MYSIENIYKIAEKLYTHRGQIKKFKTIGSDQTSEKMILDIEQGHQPALKKHVENIITMLEQAQSTVHDLVTVKQFLGANEKKRQQMLAQMRSGNDQQAKAAPKDGAGKKAGADADPKTTAAETEVKE